MPVTRSEPPPEVAQAVDAALQHFAGVPAAQLHALAGTSPAELAPTEPHEVYNLGLSDLVPRGALAATRPRGWRYLLRQQGDVVASAETVGGGGAGQQFSHFNSGPFVASTAAALDVAENLPETKTGSFELRLLHVPALHAMALWLHGHGSDDILIPLAPTFGDVVANRPYPADELLGILAASAGPMAEIGPDDTRGG